MILSQGNNRSDLQLTSCTRAAQLLQHQCNVLPGKKIFLDTKSMRSCRSAVSWLSSCMEWLIPGKQQGSPAAHQLQQDWKKYSWVPRSMSICRSAVSWLSSCMEWLPCTHTPTYQTTKQVLLTAKHKYYQNTAAANVPGETPGQPCSSSAAQPPRDDYKVCFSHGLYNIIFFIQTFKYPK